MARSNKPLTQFACNYLMDFEHDLIRNGRFEEGNTKVEISTDKRAKVFNVYLYDDLILALSVHPGTNEVMSLTIQLGSVFSFEGFPSTTTQERLNGLLDCLGHLGIIKKNTRVFINKNLPKRTACIGCGEDYVKVGRDFYRSVRLSPSEDKFEVLDGLIFNDNLAAV